MRCPSCGQNAVSEGHCYACGLDAAPAPIPSLTPIDPSSPEPPDVPKPVEEGLVSPFDAATSPAEPKAPGAEESTAPALTVTRGEETPPSTRGPMLVVLLAQTFGFFLGFGVLSRGMALLLAALPAAAAIALVVTPRLALPIVLLSAAVDVLLAATLSSALHVPLVAPLILIGAVTKLLGLMLSAPRLRWSGVSLGVFASLCLALVPNMVDAEREADRFEGAYEDASLGYALELPAGTSGYASPSAIERRPELFVDLLVPAIRPKLVFADEQGVRGGLLVERLPSAVALEHLLERFVDAHPSLEPAEGERPVRQRFERPDWMQGMEVQWWLLPGRRSAVALLLVRPLESRAFALYAAAKPGFALKADQRLRELLVGFRVSDHEDPEPIP